MKRKIVVSFLVALALFFALQANARHPSLTPATVVKVIDGDTLKIEVQGQKENIRLIGIDTPESKKNKKAMKDSGRSGKDVKVITKMGKEAAKYTKTLVEKGDRIGIEFDVQQRDHYGRLLGYVYLPDGKMLNEEIIRAGYAQPMTVPPNVKYADLFRAAYREAREEGRGLWR